MDTAQRGMGLDWPMAKELIRHSVEAAKYHDGAVLFNGAGTDHLAPGPGVTRDAVVRAYEEQCEAIEAMGGRLVLMASRALAVCAASPADLRSRLRPHPRPGRGAGDHPLAGGDVRPGARRLLGT